MNEILKKDFFRRYGSEGEPLLHRIFRAPEMRFLVSFRKAQNSKNPLRHFALRRRSIKTGIQIPARTKIGEGFYIGHFGRIEYPFVRASDCISLIRAITISSVAAIF